MKKSFFCFFLLFFAFCAADNWRDLNELHKDLKDVKLNHTQDKAVKMLFKEYHHQLKDWWKLNGQTDSLIMKLFSGEDFNIEEIKIKLKEIYDRKIDLDSEFLKQLHSILNQEQRKKISKEFGEDDQ
ncbi:hypothetical protein BKH42_02615 [Helicobacter sp. 13S00482-2]|uniref:hypothetical protein n=1 Tax=Helicobacter sp. 13S00482-2 TaxID=1476200 RepID=UPI000BA77E8A|nr:hypothetical protein [Helicobacter sp. 13S00482-2]PAF54123.1 hypothetical protein BKH42_02615 [Helicobacter sp. 13S00482-2]